MPMLLRRFLWSEPPKNFGFDGESAKAVAAKALHSVLLGALPFCVLYLGVVIPLFVARKAAASAMWAAIMLITLACMFLLRRGSVRLSSWVFLCTIWLVLAMFVALSGGITSPALLSHIAVVVVAAWLVGRRAAIGIAVLSISFGLIIAIMESVGVHLPRYFPVPPMVAWVIVAAMVTLAILPLASVNQALADSAKQAQLELEARRRQEQARAKGDQRFRATFFQAAVGIAHVGLDGKWLLINDRFCQMLGYTDAELREKTFQEITHPDDLGAVLMGRSQLLAGEISSHTMEKRYLRKDQSIFWGSLYRSLVRDQENQPIYFIAIVEDINERKKVEAALHESEERLKRAEHLAHVGHWHWDLKSNQLSWSEECLRIFGRPQEYVPTAEGFLEAVVPSDREQVRRAARERVAANNGNSGMYRIVRPNGELRTLKVTYEVLLDEQGQPTCMFGACQDITDGVRAQEESVARQKLESLGALANGIAHDFNNLLGGVLAQAELGLGELAAGSNPEAELKAIRDVALRGSEIVRELMIYAGKESAVLGLVDVSQIVEEMLELLKVSVSKHAVLKADLGKDLPAVRANAAEIGQIVMNLVTNASDAMGDQDGVIRVTTSRVKLDQNSGAIPDGLAQGEYVQLEVSDTGRGMPVETQAKVFDPFFTTKSAGHGLGLAIVHGIVRKLGGAISLTSEPGKGTTFRIWLPCAETEGETISHGISGIEEPVSPSREATVLVVEDEYPLRQAVAKMLRNGGLKVLEAADGSSGVDLLRVHGGTIDVILLDMTIPGASSSEVVAEATRARPDVKVILTSAYGEEMLAGAMSAPIIRSFIRKPFQFRDLMQTFRNALSGE